LLHDSPVWHWFPHAPQFSSSLPVALQVPPQLISFAAQQAPLSHVAPLAHDAPQAPQLRLFTRTSTHAPLHSVGSVAGQPHTPPVH
jgi:hypothetical protein